MEFAVLARPQWRLPLQSEAAPALDLRIISAPLQELELIPADPNVLKEHIQAPMPWLVFTSPASAVAFQAYLKEVFQEFPFAMVRFVAVGAGTRDQLTELFTELQRQEIVVSTEAEKADADTTLQALDQAIQKDRLSFSQQDFLVIEGQGNRPTLREGLTARQAKVRSLALYRRIDVQWPQSLWDRLAATPAGQAAIVVTSSPVIDRVIAAIRAKGLDPQKFQWCTQHATIANRLQKAGLGPIRRVRLDAQLISDDLFTHDCNW